MIYKYYDRKNPKVFYYIYKEDSLNESIDCLNNNINDEIFGKNKVLLSNDFSEKQLSLLGNEIIEKKIKSKNEENNSSNKVTNDNRNNKEIIDNIDNFINMVEKFDDHLFVYKPNGENNENLKINNSEIVQNKQNGKLDLKKIEKLYFSVDSKKKEKKNIIIKEIDKKNYEEYLKEILEQFVSFSKQYDKNELKMNYKRIKKLKDLYFELRENGYDISTIENDPIISNNNIFKFLKIHINILQLILFNKLIEKERKNLNIRIFKLKEMNKNIFECTSKKFNEILFNSNLERILDNPLNNKYSKSKIGYNKKKYDNKYTLEQLKQIKNPIIQKLLKITFLDLYYIYLFEDKDDIKGIDDIYLLDDDLNEDGKYFKSKKNKNLTKEEIKRKRLKIKIIAYKNYISMVKNRTKISKNVIKELEGTNFYEDIKNIENEYLLKKRKI